MTEFSSSRLDVLPDRVTLLWAALVLNLELLIGGMHLLSTDVTVTDPLFLLYP